MSNPIIGLIGMVVVLFFMMCKMHIAFAMAFVGFVGFVLINGLQGALGVVGQTPFITVAAYEFTVVPLFILMGYFAFHSGINQGLFNLAQKWFGSLRGGLAITTLGGCALFSAISATSMGTAATMAAIALPEMKRYNYDMSLATGVLAAGGTLGVLIPPSMGFIIYGIITEESIGKLFIAGIFPGILLASLMMLTVYVQCRINPSLGPASPPSTFKEKILAFKGVWEMLLLFILVMGGIYFGFFTPIEAGGIGATGALLIGLLKRKLGMQSIKLSIIESTKITTMIFTILFGAFIFGYFISVSTLPLWVSQNLSEAGLPPYILLIAVVFLYMILGCFMEFVSMMVLTLPIIYPLMLEMGFDPIWWGVVMVVLLELAQITPPVGINVYTIKSVAPDVPIGTIFRGVIPFFVSMLVCIVILSIFPQIATFLPSIMK